MSLTCPEESIQHIAKLEQLFKKAHITDSIINEWIIVFKFVFLITYCKMHYLRLIGLYIANTHIFAVWVTMKHVPVTFMLLTF